MPSPHPALARFSGPVRAWFGERFGAPTPVQERGWERIAAGEHTLMLAPTGSGKTLAAFLHCLDRLGREPPPAEPGVRVVYVSPIKALAYDIERNLAAPLAAIGARAEASGARFRAASVDVRTGDTPASERRRQARRPGEILITTPESLYLLLGSRAREGLRSVDTVIVDEIHAVAGGKRGAHLALSLERLAHLSGRDPQRIGLSATQRPLEEVARFLGGDREVAIVDASEPPRLDLSIVVPVADMEAPPRRLPPGQPEPVGRDLSADGSVALRSLGPTQFPHRSLPSTEISAPDRLASTWKQPVGEERGIWPSIYPQLIELIRAHRTTILFCNSRRLAERLAQRLNDLAGEELVRAHHGSVSRQQRKSVEGMLERGELRALAATSSLELGIDVAAVDLVVQIESPGAVSRGLQRIGRAGHGVGQVSRGRLFPKFRGDLLEAAVVARGMQEGAVESLRVPHRCLDVLAQQIVAACATDTWALADLERIVRRAYSFRDLSREAFVEVLEMLAGRYPSDDFADLRPRLLWDRQSDQLTARRGAGMVALVSGGTIPDRGLYPVHLGEGGPRIGELDEEMVHESRTGETFLLGASTWRIEDITRDRVIVSPAPGEPGKMPFWRGDGPGRPIELGRALGAFLRELDAADDDAARAALSDRYHLDALAADNLLRYVREQRDSAGALPSDRAIVVERFRDELGDWRVCILSPFGSRVHAPWALALGALLSRRSGIRVETLYTDDGIALRFADTDDAELPGTGELIPDPDELEDLLVEVLADSALFAGRFREAAARALLLPRRRPGQRSPLWAQRLRAQNLLAVARRYPSFPIVLEAYRECLQDVFDLPALTELLRDLRARRVALVDVETPAPSPFARSLVFAYVAAYLYEGDAPLAERRAQALTLDRTLLRDLLGQEDLRELLDARAIAEVEAELQHTAETRRARSADEVHDLLRRLGDLDDAEIAARTDGDAAAHLAELARARRADRIPLAGTERWIALEDAGRYRDAFAAAPPPDTPAAFLAPTEQPLESLLLRWARHHAPFTSAELARRYGLTAAQVEPVLRALAADGRLLGGAFRPGESGAEWCEPEVLRRLRRRSLAILRGEIAPVEADAFARFLPAWQGISTPARRGTAALRDALASLEGIPLPFSELETRILPARVADFRTQTLDELGARGEIVWIGAGALGKTDGRVALFRRDRARLLAPPPPAELELEGATDLHRAIDAHLRERGASFVAELEATAGATGDELIAALWDLVWAGRITNDTFAPLRALKAQARGRRGRDRRYLAAAGRWSSVAQLGADVAPTERALARAHMLLDRYGVVSREAAAAEAVPGGFSDLGRVLRAMEEAGQVRRGHFADGLTGAQFAHAGAVDRLRAERERSGAEVLVLAATDPANPYGALLAWPDTSGGAAPARRAGASVILIDGRPALFVERGGRRLATFASADAADLELAIQRGLPALARSLRKRSLRVDEIDAEAARRSPHAAAFERSGFRREMRSLVYEAPR